MDLQKLSLNELKILAYDLFVQLEQTQINVKLVNEAIQKKNSEKVAIPETKKEK